MNKHLPVLIALLTFGSFTFSTSIKANLLPSDEIVLAGSKYSNDTPIIYDCSKRTDCIYLDGEIKSGDFLRLKPLIDNKVKTHFLKNKESITSILNYMFANWDNENPPPAPTTFKPTVFTLLINSNGGDANEAIKIAQYIRKLELNVAIPMGKKCLSSCFFIYSAGVIRLAEKETQLGIHTPYFEKEDFRELTQEQAEMLYLGQVTKIYEQLKLFNVPNVLLEKMKNTPSNEMYYLNFSEFSDMMLDPIYRERLLAQSDLDINQDTMSLFVKSAVGLQNKAFHVYFGDLQEAHHLGGILKDNKKFEYILVGNFMRLPFEVSDFNSPIEYYAKIAEEHPSVFAIMSATTKNWYEIILNLNVTWTLFNDLEGQKMALKDLASENITENNYKLLILFLSMNE